MKPISISLIVMALAFSCTPKKVAGQDFAEQKTTPFSAIKWVEGEPILKIDTQWYDFISMGAYSKDFLLKKCKSIYPRLWKKRFGEDYVEFLWKIDIKPRLVEDFVLKNDKGETVRLALTFTKEKRKDTHNYYLANYSEEKEFDFTKTITKDEIRADLQFLRTTMYDHYSYESLKGLDTQLEMYKMLEDIPDDFYIKEFGVRLQELLVKYGDGHTRLRNFDFASYGRLSFYTTAFQDKIVCHMKDGLLEEDYPFLHAINGIPTKDLLSTIIQYKVPQGSASFVRAYGANDLKNMGFILSRRNKFSKEITIILSDGKGNKHEKKMDLVYRSQISEAKKQIEVSRESLKPFTYKKLDDRISYLKIRHMISYTPEEDIKEIMEKAKDSKGLVIDVRDNGGGGRMILNALLPYFLTTEQAPLVANLAKRRIDRQEQTEEGVISNRFLYPITSSKFSKEEKLVLVDFQKAFQPSWKYDEDKYTDWHYYLLRKDPNKYFYDKPVVILMNGKCFSATDIFLAAFNELDNVCLMGTPSGGGSGNTVSYTLPHSHWKVSLSSMISFQPNGNLYDGVGVSPDVPVEQDRLSDIIGTTDSQLEAALDYIKSRN